MVSLIKTLNLYSQNIPFKLHDYFFVFAIIGLNARNLFYLRQSFYNFMVEMLNIEKEYSAFFILSFKEFLNICHEKLPFNFLNLESNTLFLIFSIKDFIFFKKGEKLLMFFFQQYNLYLKIFKITPLFCFIKQNTKLYPFSLDFSFFKSKEKEENKSERIFFKKNIQIFFIELFKDFYKIILKMLMFFFFFQLIFFFQLLNIGAKLFKQNQNGYFKSIS